MTRLPTESTKSSSGPELPSEPLDLDKDVKIEKQAAVGAVPAVQPAQAPSEPQQPASAVSRSPQHQLRLAFSRIAVVLAVVFTVRYFYWRIGHTMNPAAKWFFYLFLVAEALNFLESALFYFVAWRPTVYATPPSLSGRSVDVFITTYNEPLELLRETLVCAVSIEYPHRTFVLDDGNRPELAELAEELGCEYVNRPDHSDAKAGNLNHALQQTHGEFILVLDADHVPAPDIIDQLIGFFTDPKIAIVQTAQDFYNLDSFQHLTNWNSKYAWQQQELFFNVIQPGKDHYNAAFYCGSPALLRREALNQVGGFATGTITEDMHTGMRLQKKGWRVLYHNRTLARGLAPQTFVGFAIQWQRWGHGAMQVLRRENPLFGRGLGFGQRLCYFGSFYFYWMGFQKLAYILTPIFCLISGVFPLVTQPEIFVLYFGPYFLFNTVASSLFQGGLRNFLMSEEFNLLKLKVLMKSATGLLTTGKFKVTPKSQAGGAGLGDVILHVLLALGILVAMGFGLKRLFLLPVGYEFWAYAVNLFWGAFYLFLLGPLVWRAMRRKELRASYRFPARLDVPVAIVAHGHSCETYARNLNRYGISVTLDEPLPPDATVELELKLPGCKVHALGRIVRNRKYQHKRNSRFSSGIRFERITPADQDEISKYLFWNIAPREGGVLRLTRMTQWMEGHK
jgi:cellulose synthase (UDP-forming)